MLYDEIDGWGIMLGTRENPKIHGALDSSWFPWSNTCKLKALLGRRPRTPGKNNIHWSSGSHAVKLLLARREGGPVDQDCMLALRWLFCHSFGWLQGMYSDSTSYRGLLLHLLLHCPPSPSSALSPSIGEKHL